MPEKTSLDRAAVLEARRPLKPVFDARLRLGVPVIMNDCDCPEAKMVAVLTRFDSRKGIWYAQYLSPHTNMEECWTGGGLGGPTPIAEFGVRLEIRGSQYRVVTTGVPSQATYRDGVHRDWQDRQGPAWRTMRVEARTALSEATASHTEE